LLDGDRQTAVAEIGQLGAEAVLMRQLATTYLVKQMLQPEDPPALLQILRDIVDGEDVHIDTYFVALHLVLHHPCTLVYHLGKGIIVVVLKSWIDDSVVSTVLIGMHELFIVLTWHINIDVVIPRYVALMPYSTYQRTTGEEIAQVMFLAEPMDIIQNTHLNTAQFLNIRYLFHISLLSEITKPVSVRTTTS